MAAAEEDERTIADLLTDQVEFADRIYLTKADLVSQQRLDQTRALVHTLNPRALISPLVDGLSEGRPVVEEILGAQLYDEATARTYEGYAEELANPHTPETEEYGISSLVFRSDRPFDKQRLLEALRSTVGLVRSKGYCWLSDNLDIVQVWHQAGPNLSIRPAAYWASSELTPGTELVLIGIALDAPALRAKLEAATLSDTEVTRLLS